MPVLYIDSKEPRAVIDAVKNEVAKRSDNISIQVTGLKTGDFVMNDVVIERKEANDYLNSITDDRLQQQEARMVADFTHKYVLMEGSPFGVKRSKMHPNAIVGKQVSSSVKKNINVIYTEDVDQLSYAVWKIMQTHADGEDGEPEEIFLKKTSADTEDTFTAMISCIEGISQEKARQISEMYKNMSYFVMCIDKTEQSTLKRLQKLDGIGPTLAQRVIDEIKGG